MSTTSGALKRLGVLGAAVATVGAGFTALAATPAAAVAPNPPTTVTLVPVDTAVSTTATDAFQGNTTPSTTAGKADRDAACQQYTVLEKDAQGNTTNAPINIILTPSAGVAAEFCSSTVAPSAIPGGGTPAPGAPGQPIQAQGTPTSGGTAMFGVAEATSSTPGAAAGTAAAAVAGTISILAYYDADANGQPAGTSAEPSDSAVQHIVSAPASAALQNNDDGQDEIVTKLTASPPNTTQTANNGSGSYIVTAVNGASSLVAGAQVFYEVKSSQGNVVTTNTSCGFTQNGETFTSGHNETSPSPAGATNGTSSGSGPGDGQVTCNVPTPPNVAASGNTPAQTGPYTITFYVKKPSCDAGSDAPTPTTQAGATCEPTTTATLTTVAAAPTGSTVTVTCGTPTSEHLAASWCAEPLSARTETFTATVTGPAPAGGGSGAPIAGAQVAFALSSSSAGSAPGCYPSGPAGYFTDCGSTPGSESASLSPVTCVTGSDGTCSTTLTIDGAPNEGDTFYVTATIQDAIANSSSTTPTPSNTARVSFTDNFQANDTTVTIAPKTPTATVGTTQVETATVSNQFGNTNPNNNDLVTFTITGVGTFTDGTTSKTVTAGTDGKAQVAVTSSTVGQSTVTASLAPNNSSCGETAAGNADGTPGGQCSDTATITWSTSGGTTGPCTTAPTIHVPRTLHGAGNIRISGVACKGATVSLFQGGQVRRTTTASTTDGSYSVVFEINRTTAFQVRDESNGKLSPTGIAVVYEAPFVFLGSPRHGVVTVTLKSNPIVSGLRIDLYVVTSSGRHRVAIEHMGSTGSLTFNISAPAATSQRYQAYGFNSTGIAPGWSAVKAVWVHR